MEILTALRSRLHQQLLNKELLGHQIKRRFVFWEKAQTIGLLFDASSLEERNLVLGFAERLKTKGKQVKMLGFFNTKLKSSDFPFKHFDKTQLDWALRPKKEWITGFANQPLDLLINLSKNSIIPLDYIAAHSKARFRVGPFTENTFCYDLMIENDERKGLEAFLKHVLHYLEKMQPAGNAAVVEEMI